MLSKRFLIAVAVLLGVAIAVGVGVVLRRTEDSMGGLPEALVDRGRVARVGAEAFDGVAIEGTELVDIARLPELSDALAGFDPDALVAAMEGSDVSAILVGSELAAGVRGADGALVGPDVPLLERLVAFDRIPSVRAVRLAPAGALYEPEPTAELDQAHRDALARVARAIIGGESPPPLEAFPEPLRAVSSVEVMVLLRDRGAPRLWRSARGSSIARSLTTAAVFARQRWNEREHAMGGNLDELLPRLDVEVALLLEDGTLGARDSVFLERVFKSHHGVAYERRSTWRYLLPSATQEAGGGSAVSAYRHLFAQNGLPESTLESPDCRLYRLVVQPLSTSAGEAAARRSSDPLPSAGRAASLEASPPSSE